MDRFQSMTAFLAVVDTGGFASAARRLKVSPSVVTRAVSDLEERLGVRLLTRTTRFVRVTEAGTAYADSCRRILAELEERSEEHTSELQSPCNLVCRLLLEKKKRPKLGSTLPVGSVLIKCTAW